MMPITMRLFFILISLRILDYFYQKFLLRKLLIIALLDSSTTAIEEALLVSAWFIRFHLGVSLIEKIHSFEIGL